MTYIMLSAWNRGIGSCIVGMFDDKDLSKYIKLNENEEFCLLIIMGYISKKSVPSEEYHLIKKPVSDLFIKK